MPTASIRVDVVHDGHHRAQPDSRTAVGLVRALHHRAGGAGCLGFRGPLGSAELLFANKLYRQWFGSHTEGHLQLVAQAGKLPIRHQPEAENEDGLMGLPTDTLTAARSENAEIFVPSLGKWLEVRSRYLSWVDGRLAQMVIATDITQRRLAEEQAAAQAEKAQTASRLITMGEMASSVAHELNQPLTAISNYSSAC
jgi:signal transduction histidine kinase